MHSTSFTQRSTLKPAESSGSLIGIDKTKTCDSETLNMPIDLAEHRENTSHFPSGDLPDKFQSIFDPWGDYVFAIVMIVIGKSIFFFSLFHARITDLQSGECF